MHLKNTVLFLILVITSFAVPYGVYSLGYFNPNEERIVETRIFSNAGEILPDSHYAATYDCISYLCNIEIKEITPKPLLDFDQIETLEELFTNLISLNSLNTGTRYEIVKNHQLEVDESFWFNILPTLVSLGVVISKKEEYQENIPLRDVIYHTIEISPGIHFRELCRELNKKNGVI
ncbi:MAG: hypothetical protein ACFFCQ_15885, partial [Promethearchaeota archaeon]